MPREDEGNNVRHRDSALRNAGAAIVAAPPAKQASADPLGGHDLQDPLAGGAVPEHLQRPVTAQTAASADAFAGATFPGLENFLQFMTPVALGGPKKDSRLRGQQLAPAVKDFRGQLKEEVPTYGKAVAASNALGHASTGLSVASTGAALSGFGAPAAPALSLAASGAKIASGTAELGAASALDQRPASPTGRGVAQQGLHEVDGTKKVVQGTAGLTMLPGASMAAGVAYDQMGGNDVRKEHQVNLVEGVRQAELIKHGRRAGQVQGAAPLAPAAAPPPVVQHGRRAGQKQEG